MLSPGGDTLAASSSDRKLDKKEKLNPLQAAAVLVTRLFAYLGRN
jgi:hypothetical protein